MVKLARLGFRVKFDGLAYSKLLRARLSKNGPSPVHAVESPLAFTSQEQWLRQLSLHCRKGMLIAPIWKRIVALALDAFLITIVLALLTRNSFFIYVVAIDLMLTSQAPYVVGSWIIHLTLYWLILQVYR